ncbi:sensor domain-containing diguanylate cyclase [Paenibacillus sp. FA6]|uniref:sensor domain-containing diguanylate cyclase n=1 Tax=Paenibacillus sp. FA6 TaxID=3413029 RepID=UPI003F660612
MTLLSEIIPLFTHFIPILFFMFMMTEVLLRNHKRTEHRLVFAIMFCCMMLFLEEYVRHQLPIEYSPMISAIWFSTAGIMFPGLGLHLFMKLTRLEHKIPQYIFPYICYLPVVFVLINILFFNEQMISVNEFHQVGIWKQPVYNKAYYAAMIGSNFFNVLYLMILAKGKMNASTDGLKGIYNRLMLGICITGFINLTVGMIDFKGYLPPYPYIYGSIAWCIILRHTMMRYDFLNHIDKRYEKLFNLNPSAIMLIDLNGNMKEANPSAKQLFDYIHMDHTNCYTILNEEIKRRIHAREEISNYEMMISIDDRRMDVLIDGDYVLFEYEPHLILIMRDVTKQKVDQREITFLAYHDPLTRLPNRRYFYETLDAAILDAGNNHHKLAIVMFDLDYFKNINDKYGHHVGDQALMHVADLIRKVIHLDGMAARLGGDEFAFFLTTVFSAEMDKVQEKIDQFRRLLEENKMFVLDEHVPIQLSIGVSFYPDNGLDGDTLLKSADKVLYDVKHQRPGHKWLLSEV